MKTSNRRTSLLRPLSLSPDSACSRFLGLFIHRFLDWDLGRRAGDSARGAYHRFMRRHRYLSILQLACVVSFTHLTLHWQLGFASSEKPCDLSAKHRLQPLEPRFKGVVELHRPIGGGQDDPSDCVHILIAESQLRGIVIEFLYYGGDGLLVALVSVPPPLRPDELDSLCQKVRDSLLVLGGARLGDLRHRHIKNPSHGPLNRSKLKGPRPKLGRGCYLPHS